jgi:hypothetical protein
MVYLLTLFPIACVVYALDYILFDNATNRTGLDYLGIVLWPLGFCAILSFFLYKFKKEKNRQFLVSLGTNIMAIPFFLFIEHFNIMVQYEKWVQRSMPEPFEIHGTKEREYPRELDLRYLEVRDKLRAGKISREEYNQEKTSIIIEIIRHKEQYKERQTAKDL